MALNFTNMRTSSDGAWQGDNPLHHAFPLLIVQTLLILFVSRFLAFLLKPLRQPKVIAEILGGILLGPSALGRNKDFLEILFPSWSTPILESVASIGLLFYLFLVGLELDLISIRRSGRRAISIALAGISLPFFFGVGLAFFTRKVIHGENKVGYPQLLVFTGVALSITAFPVLARILAELKLLTTRVGETAMAAAAFNDIAAWILLALAVALAGGSNKSPLVSIWVLISGVGFVAFQLTLVRPFMNWVARRCSSDHDLVDEAYICLTLAGVLLSGFMTDMIGIHAIFGAFVFGLTIPKGGEFAARLTKRIEDFVSGLLLPLYFASSGLKTDVAKIQGLRAWGLVALVISVSCTGKILGTFLVAMLFMIPVRESLALGVLMNTKGLVELIVLNIGKEKKILNDEMFAILTLMAVFTTFMTTPAVMAIYKPSWDVIASQTPRLLQGQHSPTKPAHRRKDLRILACVHGPGSVPSLVNLIESVAPASQDSSPLKVYVMHLVELTDRSSSIMMVHRARKNGFPFINRLCRGVSQDQIPAAFEAYGQVGQVTTRHTTAISALSTMQEDILHVAEAKTVSLVILPFNKQWRREEEKEMEVLGDDWKRVNQRVLSTANCSVALFVDRGFGSRRERGAATPKRVCILFLGGPDDREALEFGGRLAHSTVMVTVVKCITDSLEQNHEKELDEAAVAELRRCNESVEYIEKVVTGGIAGTAVSIGLSREYDLVIVGKEQQNSELACHRLEHAELGQIGDTLASSPGISCSVLVIQTPRTRT
ncbi:cation/H(+) antiporter 20-like isoform X1 [Malus sylvestris]|uniref:cation/H(+) antiporter 20-like isoform X1 n=1 Tax=Malus sylvestris TaxID=3752 RepID=UPI0021ACCF8E|nr:cation/H(+) antiporter 20-like isoform X1 [Malus sylvestris]